MKRSTRLFLRLFAVAHITQTLLMALPAHAQISGAAGAPAGMKPVMDAAANGVPIVLIAPPGKAGVSRNQFGDFNVAPKGLILNNSAAAVQTQIGGWINGNLQLGGVPARIILNEVVGPNASHIRGAIEVAGRRADVVIANPNGITCDGCGFLNTGRASLSTGSPQFREDGALDGFNVRQGVVSVGADGLNAPDVQQLDLLARGIVIEGVVWSQAVHAIAGVNTVRHGETGETPVVSPLPVSGEPSRFAVDIKDMGGMYAGQIYLQATEKGLGVNSAGRVATLVGNLHLQANGDLLLKDVQSARDAVVSAVGGVTVAGQLVAAGSLRLESGKAIDNAVGLIAGGNVDVKAEAVLNARGRMQAQERLAVHAGRVSGGVLAAGKSVQLELRGDQLQTGSVLSDGDVSIATTGRYVNRGTVSALGVASISAYGITNETQGIVESKAVTLDARAGALVNDGLINAMQGAAVLNAASLANTGVIVGDSVRVTAATVANRANAQGEGAVIASRAGDVVIDGALTNTGGSAVLALGGIHVAGDVANNGSVIHAAGDVRIDGQLSNTNARLVTGSATRTEAGGATYIIPSGDTTRYDVNDLRWTGDTGGHWILPSTRYPWVTFGSQAKRRAVEFLCNGASDASDCSLVYPYAAGDALWDLFNVRRPGTVVPEPGSAPNSSGCTIRESGETGHSSRDTAGACGTWWVGVDAYTESLPPIHAELDAAIVAFNADLHARQLIDWYELSVTGRTVEQTTVESSKPASMLAGGNISLAGVVNRDSIIAAAGDVSASGAVQNLATQGTVRTTDLGTMVFSHRIYDNDIFNESYWRQVSAPQSIEAVPVVQTFDLPTLKFQSGATPSAPAAVQAGAPAGAVLVPQNQLFRVNSQPAANYLIETNPAFTNYRLWIASDYMLEQLGIDPERQMKRYGDGFAEQRLIDDQILALTGRRFLTGYGDTELEYQALMDAGVMLAKRYQLTPGVALSPEQVAALTSDIVWLETKTVALPDGSVVQALVPTVYLRRPAEGDMSPAGALIAGGSVSLRAAGDVVNTGTVRADGLLEIEARSVSNSGRLAGNQVGVSVQDMLDNTGGTIQGVGTGNSVSLYARDIVLRTTTNSATSVVQGPNGTTKGAVTSVDRVATVSGDRIVMQALENIRFEGASVKATGDLTMAAGGSIDSRAVDTGYTLDIPLGGNARGRSSHYKVSEVSQQLTSIEAGGNAAIVAGAEASFKGSQVSAGKDLSVVAADITIEAAKNSSSVDQQGAGRRGYERVARSDETLVGGSMSAEGNINLRATDGDVRARGAAIEARTGAATLVASESIALEGISTRHDRAAESYNSSKGLLSSKSVERSTQSEMERHEGTTVSGATVGVVTGRDVVVHGSSVASDTQTLISAGRDVIVSAGEDTHSGSSKREEKKSGVFGGGGSITLGSQEKSTAHDSKATSSVASTIGSLAGDVTIVAGNQYSQEGSHIVAPGGDITIAARNVAIVEARETSSSRTEQTFKQGGITLAVQSPVLSALQTIEQVGKAARQSGDVRTKAMAAATVALAGKNATDAVGQNPGAAGGFSISLSVGASSSTSESRQQADTTAGSTVVAGGNVSIVAGGGGNDSNILIRGSSITAASGDTLLRAENDIVLEAARNTESHSSSSRGKSGSIGISLGSQTGITVSASTSKGRGNGDDTTWTNTHVGAGGKAILQSGGDATLRGAVVQATAVQAQVGGDLRIESLQDTSTYNEESKSAGGSVTIGPAPGGSLNLARTRIDSNYRSVTEQSGIKAGDGGFDVTVGGATELTGGVIASTEAAVQNGSNTFQSAGGVTLKDLRNEASYSGSSFGIGGGYSHAGAVGKDDQGGAATGTEEVPGTRLGNLGGFSATVPVGLSAKGNASSVTTSGISGIAGNQAVRSGDASGGIAPILDIGAIKAGFEVTSALVGQAGTFLENRAREADAKRAERDEAAGSGDVEATKRLEGELQALEKWGPSGSYRQVTTAVIGALSGNVTGSGSQLVQAAAVNYLQTIAAAEVGRIADALGSESARAALQGVVACAGAAAQGAGCQQAALGASAGVVVNALLGDADSLSAQEKEARRNIVTSLVAGLASRGDGVSAALNAVAIESENNALSLRGSALLNSTLRACQGRDCDLTKLRAGLEVETTKQDARIKSACTGADANVAQCMALGASADKVAADLLIAAFVYADRPEKKKLVYELIERQIGDMERMEEALEAIQGTASVREQLGAAIASTVQAIAGAAITLKPRRTPSQPVDRPLDWSTVSKSGETRVEHVNIQHGNLKLQKQKQGVFYGDPVRTTNEAWQIAKENKIKPIRDSGVDIYLIPRANSGYAGGYSGQRENLDYVTIITATGTNKIITAYPGSGAPPLP
jgi:filamentous hemagglutinin